MRYKIFGQRTDLEVSELALGTGLPLATINAWGIRVAAFVSSQPGATPHPPDYLHQP